MERGILVVSFGTTYQETREKNIDQMVALVREQYPHYLVEEAYSSSTVRKVLRERDGIAKDDVRQALCRMRDAGVRRVIVFPTHIIDGIENHRMKQEVTDCAPWFEDVRIADALLKTPEDYQRTAEALWESVAAEAGSSPVIFMGYYISSFFNYSSIKTNIYIFHENSTNGLHTHLLCQFSERHVHLPNVHNQMFLSLFL